MMRASPLIWGEMIRRMRSRSALSPGEPGNSRGLAAAGLETVNRTIAWSAIEVNRIDVPPQWDRTFHTGLLIWLTEAKFSHAQSVGSRSDCLFPRQHLAHA